MIQSRLQNPATASSPRRPTDYLLLEDADNCSLLMIYRHIMGGFAMKGVEALLASCVLQSTRRTMIRALGVSTRTAERHRNIRGDVRLTPQQSALAFQYAQVLELSTSVFGKQTRAEEWLGRPCRSLDGNVPLIMVENVFGAQAVDNYLRRIEMGVYQ